jgi:hypothetical protein
MHTVVCTCIHLYVHVSTCIYLYVNSFSYLKGLHHGAVSAMKLLVYVCVTHLYLCTFLCTFWYVYTFVCIHLYVCTFVCIHLYVYTLCVYICM